MPDINIAYQYVIDVCNDPYIGYDIPRRTTGTLGVNYETFFDCSSLMSKCLTVAGYFDQNPWFSTDNEPGKLLQAGFIEVPITGQWLPGDITYYPPGWQGHTYGHTEMVYQGGNGTGITMGAHGKSGRAFVDQVSINQKPTRSGYYQKLFRDPTGSGAGAAVHIWHADGNGFNAGSVEMTDNAFLIWQYFRNLGFTNEAIAGLLGNLQQESTLDPWRYQNGVGPGYGLPQWDPASGWFNYAQRNNIDTTDPTASGEGQCQCINDGESEGQWLPNTPTAIEHNTRYTWAEFSQLTDVNEAVRAFLYEYERAGTPNLPARYQYAADWYTIMQSGLWYGDVGRPGPKDVERAYIMEELRRRLVLIGRH